MQAKSKTRDSKPRVTIKASKDGNPGSKRTKAKAQPPRKSAPGRAVNKILEASEQQFRSLFENLPIGFGVADLQGNLLAFNNAMLQPGGYSREDILRIRNVSALYYNPGDRDRILDLYRQQGKLKNHPVRFKRKDGTPYDILLTLMPTTFQGQPCIQAMAEDLTERKRLEENLRESQSKFRDLVERLPQVIYTSEMGVDGTWEYVSPQIEELLGFSAHEWMADPTSWERHVHPDDLSGQQKLEEDAFNHGKTFEGEYRMFNREGREIWVRDAGQIHSAEAGRQPIVQGLLTDITERKQAEEAVRQSEETTRLIIDTALDAVIIINQDGQVTRWNDQAEIVFGWTRAEAEGQRLSRLIIPPDLRAKHEQGLKHYIKTGEGPVLNKRIEITAQRRNGNIFPVELTIHALNTNGHVSFAAFVRDITAPKQAEEKLRESEENYRTLVDEMLDGVYRSSHDGKFVDVNPAMLKMFGYDSREQMLTLDIKMDMYFSPGERESLFLDTGQEKVDEFRMKRRDGSEIWVEDHGRYVHDQAGKVIFHEGVLRDITDRKQAEQRLLESEERYRQLVEHLPAITYTARMDEQHTRTYVSPQIETLLGVTPPEYLADSELWMRMIHPDDHERVLSESRQLYETGEPFVSEYRTVARDGHVLWFHDEAVVVRDPAGRPHYLQGLKLDITARKQAEEALRQAEKKYRTLVEQLPIMVYVNPVEDISTTNYVSPQIEEILGYTPDEWLTDPTFWSKALHPDDRPRVLKEVDYVNRTGEPFDSEYRMIARDGQVVWIRDQSVLLRDSDGRPAVAWQGLMSNITARKQAEEKLRESEARLSLFFNQSLDGFFFSMLEEPKEWSDSIDKEEVLDYVLENQHITEANDAMLEQYGATRATFIGRTASDFFADDLEQARVFRRALFDQGHLHVETQERKDDGTLISVEGDYVCMYDPTGKISGMFGIQRDVSERKQSQRALLQFRSVLDQSRDAIFMIDPQTSRYVDFNEQAHSFLGYTADELRGLSVTQVAQHIPTMDDWRERAQLVRASNGLTFESSYLRKDRTIFPVEVSARMLEYAGQEIMVAIVRDITERKMAEQQIREQIQRLNSLHTVDSVINASFDLKIINDVLLEQIINQLHVDAADILLLNPDSLTLYYYAGRGFRSYVARDDEIRLGESLAGTAALERRTIYVTNPSDLELEKEFAALWQKEGFQAYAGIPLIAKGQVTGVLELFQRQPFELDSSLNDFLETLAGQAAIAINNAQLFERLQRTNMDLSLAYDATIEGWSRAMDLRDHETEGHTQRVTTLTLDLARFMNIPDSDLIHIYRGALLHDIGKISAPDSILFKPGALSPAELDIMRQHPLHAFNMLSPIEYLRPALDIPYCHHEKWDGTGYPRGLYGVEIPLAARIFAVADVWDAVCSDRPYRLGWSEAEAEKYIVEQSGKYFDPQVVDAFLQMLRCKRSL